MWIIVAKCLSLPLICAAHGNLPVDDRTYRT